MKSENIKSVLVVGGGTAGWMTASLLARFFPDKDITLVESEDIGIVGVGESTLGGINWYLNALGLKDEDWMKHCNASYKMSIKFTDFYEKDRGGFHYPFGMPYIQDTGWQLWDWQFLKYKYPDTPITDYVNSYYPGSYLFENNKISKNEDGAFDNLRFDTDVAYHFDSLLFGRYLREHYAKPRGVKHIVGTVTDVSKSDKGIEFVTLEDGQKLSADLFIDCTGFRSLLLGQTLQEPFISKDHVLVNNRAWAAQVPYKDKEKELEPFTNGTAIENGWCWNIPLWSRLGTGYVYSDKYVDPEDAKEEYKRYLMSDKMIIPRTREEVDALEFKDIKMRVGIHERTWVKNVLAIGLSAGFIEPLESNGLYSVHEFLFKAIRVLSLPRVNQLDKDMHNAACRGTFENFTEFVSMHYALSHRTDTKYWRDISERTFSRSLITLEPDRTVGYFDFQNTFMFENEYKDQKAGIHCIATGLEYPMVDDYIMSAKQLDFKYTNFDNMAKDIKASFINKKNRWKKAAEKAPTLYQYLLENIHND